MNYMLRILTAMALFLTSQSGIAAEGNFNPSNPPDPVPTYTIKVTATPSEYAYASGTGMYAQGAQVFISSSSGDTDYEFAYWEKDGVRISESQNFYFTVEAKDAIFTAVYQLKTFDPSSPDDPNYTYVYPLILTCNPQDACSFNLDSGRRFESGVWVNVEAYPSQGFEFLGWYENGTQVSTSLSFNYQMPSTQATLRANFKYNPSSPDDPSSDGSQQEVANPSRSDVNGDYIVDVSDATAVINWFLSTDQYNLKYDMNIDNTIDVSDSTHIINTYLSK